MGLYGNHLFPRLMDWVLAGEEFRRLRTTLLAPVRGAVLELGLGTGLNLPHYPPGVSKLTAVDPAVLLPNLVRDRSAHLPFPVDVRHVTAETLPYDDGAFDVVVSTWTLCTIPDPVQALREVRRVLKPEGTFLFLEHGRSDDPKVAIWQDQLNPLQKIIGCGCHLNRRIDQLVAQAGLQIVMLDRFDMKSLPRIGGTMYRGTAGRPSATVGQG